MKKNPTKKLVKKKPKKGKGSKKKEEGPVTTSWEDTESFFSIVFVSATTKEQDKLDFSKEDAEFFREDLVPNSMEYYLDIMGNDEEYDDEEGEECEDDECDDNHGKKENKPKSKEKPTAPKKPGEEGGDDKKCKNQ